MAGVLVGTTLVLAVAIWGLYELTAGAEQRRMLVARSALDEVERRARTPLARLDVALHRTELGRRLSRRIARSGVEVRVSTFVVAMVAAAVLAVIFVWQILAPVFGIAAAVGVGWLFFSYLRRQEERRREEFTGQLPELARVLSNATSAGLALPTAIDMAADELDDPAGSEMRRLAQAMKVGQPFETALNDLSKRMPSRELGVLTSTLLVASRAGGSLVTSLRNISETLENRKETRREVRTILTETTSTTWALGLMGVGALFLINAILPDILRNMTASLAGQLVLGLSALLFIFGLVLVRRITRIDF
ncbi:type II secretion system F family protein [Salinactinospora qingdaonensis]